MGWYTRELTEIESGDGGLFGVPGHVRTDQGKEGDEGRWRGLGEVVACETAAVVRQRQADDEAHPEDGDQQAGRADQDAVLVAVADKAADDESDDFDSAARRGVEEGFLRRVAKGFDELVKEVGDAA